LTGANLSSARIQGDLIAANFTGADLRSTDLTGACLSQADFTQADLGRARLNNVTIDAAELRGANLDEAILSSAHLDDLDVTAFCDARTLNHSSPSFIDSRTVIRSFKHPKLKRFMVECGVPEIFAEYMIECARAVSEPVLRSLMQSTFISYGGEDEKVAKKLYNALRANNVIAFFFPESALLGERIDTEVFRRLHEHDRVLLVCSRHSLNQKGVLNEIQETLNREARDGGASYLLPIMLDNYVLKEWNSVRPDLADRVTRRIIGDFTRARASKLAFNRALARVLDALKVKKPQLVR
jgi:hypothetical protein